VNIDPTHPRLGIPDDRMGAYSTPLKTEINGEVREAVVIILYPPTALRDAPLEVIEHFVSMHKKSMLSTIAQEIYKSYTSDPVDATGARNIAEALTKHAEAISKGARR
jgi:hypothetical protein